MHIRDRDESLSGGRQTKLSDRRGRAGLHADERRPHRPAGTAIHRPRCARPRGVTGDEIRRSGATNLPEALRLAPALDVVQVSATSYTVSARGFINSAANKLLVLVDGRSVYTPLFSGSGVNLTSVWKRRFDNGSSITVQGWFDRTGVT